MMLGHWFHTDTGTDGRTGAHEFIGQFWLKVGFQKVRINNPNSSISFVGFTPQQSAKKQVFLSYVHCKKELL